MIEANEKGSFELLPVIHAEFTVPGRGAMTTASSRPSATVRV
jgi:hypothetical protein